MTKIEIATTFAKSLLWTPYVWGGKNPMVMLDCSGFTQAVLSHPSVGVMAVKPVLNSRAQFKLLTHRATKYPKEGCLVFWGKPERVTHIGYCLDGKHCICAAGGNSLVTSVLKAYKRGACVKILSINYRRDVVGFANPFKEE